METNHNITQLKNALLWAYRLITVLSLPCVVNDGIEKKGTNDTKTERHKGREVIWKGWKAAAVELSISHWSSIEKLLILPFFIHFLDHGLLEEVLPASVFFSSVFLTPLLGHALAPSYCVLFCPFTALPLST